ncbi:hypothetical protein FGG79_02405 [Bacillus sp. BHET2]|uniref:hypothetical protein n=1 Tax=Bacillus sp. BHET2 TaxID=2583818 RepID=UPI00110EE7F1|nr:hypothetical protein [Bacillus sp. BHET2]TMU87012.1 hypothetical protein FGG79_02405 [Bacillus sp. BHET2]
MNKILTIINIIAVIAVVLFIIQPIRTAPPTPNVTVGEVAIPTSEGSYCWEGFISGQCVDKEYSSVVAMADEYQPTTVSQNEKIKVTFDKKPKTLEVERWMGEEEVEIVEIKDDFLGVPKEKGVYVYHIISNWKQGDGSYVFSVEVK